MTVSTPPLLRHGAALTVDPHDGVLVRTEEGCTSLNQVRVLVALGADPPPWWDAAVLLDTAHRLGTDATVARSMAVLSPTHRCFAVRNRQPDDPVVALLVHDPHPSVRSAVAALIDSSDAGSALARQLMHDPAYEVQYAVADHRRTPPDVLAVLAGDANVELRRTVALNPSTPVETLVVLASDPALDVIGALLLHQTLAPQVCAAIARHPDPLAREGAVRRDDCPAGVLRARCTDSDPGVRTAAHAALAR